MKISLKIESEFDINVKEENIEKYVKDDIANLLL